ncbi:hypothetical protein PGTUg99_007250 [Puccinia graminis f. sp. tritici]|uniref:Uncharacterized protein n=1 Tax=Puccinia graminis f. sp. tritici TaxID=56615 RepID=A0A5B0MKB5_PUCGR|nr:hypothetical protein PGTUg99_007250 [Puccinia graminis f. sp. tritici]
MPSYRVVSVRIRVAMCRFEGEFFGFCHSSKGTLNDENATGQCVVKLEKTLAIEIPGIFEFSWCLTSVPQVLSVDSIETALNLSSLGARARAGASIRLSPHVRFALNGSLVTLMVVPGALLLWISILVARSLRIIETNTDRIVATLIETAPSYRAETYSYLSVLRLLKPMASTLEIATRLNRYTKIVLLLYLLQHLLIAIVYLPISVIALRGLRKRAVPKDLLQRGSVQICTPTHQDTIDKVRKRLINHALLIYLQEILYCPTLVYMLCAPSTKLTHFSDPTWVLVEQVAIHGPIALIGNIILSFLIQNALYAARSSCNHLHPVDTDTRPKSVLEIKLKTEQHKETCSL